MTTRKELIEALRVRYRGATYGDRVKILDEFAAITGHRLSQNPGSVGPWFEPRSRSQKR
jgi:hypothetical protein